MHQTKKGNEWRFGMKCHIGVYAFSELVHTMEVTPANVHDITIASKLIWEVDEVVYGDSGYIGLEKREEIVSDEHHSIIDYRINRRPSSLQRVSDGICFFQCQFICAGKQWAESHRSMVRGLLRPFPRKMQTFSTLKG